MCIWLGFFECFMAGIGRVLDACIWSVSVECFIAGILLELDVCIC